jgi:hypothetical protein
LEVNQLSQLFKSITTGASHGATGVTGNDSSGAASSSFEDLLNQIVNNSRDQTLKNASTSGTSTDNAVSGLSNIALQSQKAEQLQQVVMQQMMQMMSTQDATSSSSIGSVESDDSSDSLFPSTNSNDLTKLLQTLVQQQSDTSATEGSLTNSSQVNNLMSKSI